MMDELKPCPFCGEQHLWTYSVSYAPDGLRFVKCSRNPHEDDGCVSGVSVSTWQSRPIEDKLRAENERLRSALAWYADENNYLRGAPGENVFLAESLTPMWLCDVGERARKALKGGG